MADINDGNMQTDDKGGSTPRPDPTVLTTEALRREVAALKELINSNMFSAQALSDSKFDQFRVEIDNMKAYRDSKIADLRTELMRAEEILGEKIDSLRDDLGRTETLRNEKFKAVQLQFELSEQHRIEQKHDTQAAVDAALAAAKEAVNAQTVASDRSITKSETATSEQLKQMNVTTTTAIAGINLIIDDVKERINRIEAIRSGARENMASTYALVGLIVAILVAGISIIAFVR